MIQDIILYISINNILIFSFIAIYYFYFINENYKKKIEENIGYMFNNIINKMQPSVQDIIKKSLLLKLEDEQKKDKIEINKSFNTYAVYTIIGLVLVFIILVMLNIILYIKLGIKNLNIFKIIVTNILSMLLLILFGYIFYKFVISNIKITTIKISLYNYLKKEKSLLKEKNKRIKKENVYFINNKN